MNSPVRIECYNRIRAYAKEQITKHFEAHPEDLNDPRLAENLAQSLKGYQNLFDILDDYEISRRVEK